MNTKRRIVVGLDFSDRDLVAVETALLEAVVTPTELHVLHVVQPVTQHVLDRNLVPDGIAADAKRLADRVAKIIGATLDGAAAPPGLSTFVHTAVGAPAREIVHLAAHVGADLVIVGTHGRHGLERLVLGSVAEQVVRLSGCPVLAARRTSHSMEGVVPEIEPLCADCVARRQRTGGEDQWCARHSEHHPHAHTYHYQQLSNSPARAWGFNRQVPQR